MKKRPPLALCVSCPFRTNGHEIPLHAGRIREIHAKVTDGYGFTCHKTVNHDLDEVHQETGQRPYDPRERQCAGALAYALNCGTQTGKDMVSIRTADTEELRKIERIAKSGKVYMTLAAWLAGGSLASRASCKKRA